MDRYLYWMMRTAGPHRRMRPKIEFVKFGFACGPHQKMTEIRGKFIPEVSDSGSFDHHNLAVVSSARQI